MTQLEDDIQTLMDFKAGKITHYQALERLSSVKDVKAELIQLANERAHDLNELLWCSSPDHVSGVGIHECEHGSWPKRR